MTTRPNSSAAPTTDEVALPLVDEMVEKVDKELSKLHSAFVQYQQYEQLKARLLGNASAASSTASTSRSRSGPRDQNLQETFVGLVREFPGEGIPFYAQKMGKQPGYVYKLREKAKVAGQIREVIDGTKKTYVPVAEGEADPNRVAELEAAAAAS